ncbi:response regulator transcription factor [Rhodoplanes azumiensis]|uniref:Response regulator transcription factor n=1 Tax=Rhodoplanes azumiensis TaxID=1897628 RepID=A0ABW5AKI6_9BRAD
MRVLVVEDNEELAGLVVGGLRKSGHLVDHVPTGGDARDILATHRFAVVILDLGLPDADGLSVLRGLRARNDPTAVLVLTARSGIDDRVEALRCGADDYLIKPFAFEELIARLEALARRPRELHGPALVVGNVTFDPATRQVQVDDAPHVFSSRELVLLEALMRRKGRVATKRVLEDELAGSDGELSANAVEVYVHRLRKHLGELGARVTIHTVRGVGYLIREADA